jgi:hypothetical protein
LSSFPVGDPANVPPGHRLLLTFTAVPWHEPVERRWLPPSRGLLARKKVRLEH